MHICHILFYKFLAKLIPTAILAYFLSLLKNRAKVQKKMYMCKKKNALLQEICVFSIIFGSPFSFFRIPFPISLYHFPRLNRTFLQSDGYIRPKHYAWTFSVSSSCHNTKSLEVYRHLDTIEAGYF